ncbi:MAG: FkbM family methyltransferase [Alphaproteobacteria bacterium]|nr:MAG: FkbM family methyltransferase [Alphaproteobacteria bacterium]
MEKNYVKSVDGRWGKCHFFEQDEYIGKSIFHYGEYNPDETEFILGLAAKAGKDKLVLDIGANIGVIAQALAFAGFTVEAFEPQPEVFELLTANFKGKAHNVALGEARGKTIMPKLIYSERFNFGGVSCETTSRSRGGIDVHVEKIDDYKFDNVGLMKIDVEGFEERVLRGAVETINRCSPILYLEDDREQKSASLHAFLQELGYRWEPHRPPLFRPNNFFGKAENVWSKNFVSKNIVCYK